MPPRRLMPAVLAVLVVLLGCGSDPAGPGAQLTTTEPLRWDWINPTPQGEDVNALDTQDDAWIAVGDGGAVLVKRPGEVLWTAVDRPIVGDLQCVVVQSADEALAAGEEGILRTHDGGRTWEKVLNIGAGLEFTGIDARNENAAAVGDNLLFVSNDSGATWVPASISSTTNLRHVAFFADNAAVCYATTGQLYRTFDDGASWALTAPGQLPANLVDLEFTSPNSGIALASTQIYRTNDSGSSWTPIDVSPSFMSSAGASALAVSFPRINHGIIVTASGQTFESRNGGLTWHQTGLGTFPIAALDFAAADTSTWSAVGRQGFVADTFDDGANWIDRLKGDRGDFVDIAFATPNVGVAIGSPQQNPVSGTFRTVNGGSSWSSQFFAMDAPTAIRFLDEAFGLVVTNVGDVFRTTNAGATWTDISPPDLPQTIEQFSAVTILDEETYLVGGFGSTIMKTTDAGLNWQPVLFAAAVMATSGSLPVGNVTGLDRFPGTSTVIAVGSDGMLRSNDGGDNWAPVDGFTNFEDVACFSATEGVAVNPIRILRSDDAGATWDAVYSINDIPLFATSTMGEIERFTDIAMRGRRGIAVGPLGVLFESVDRGVTWNPGRHVTTTTIFAVTFSDDDTGWAVGSGGLIIRGARE